MHRVVEYTLMFIVLVLLQVFLFDNLNLSPYCYPLVYVGFILLLPVTLLPAWTLLLGFAIGAVTDLLSGTPGLHTIAATATAFCRRAMAAGESRGRSRNERRQREPMGVFVLSSTE